MYRVAIVAIARLENDYLKEWIDHHIKLGINHIYIYDNSFGDENKIEFSDILNVTVFPAYNKIRYQNEAYTEAYRRFNNLYDYIIFIDIDEFIIFNNGYDLKMFINNIPKDAECVRINWQCFSDNDIINRDVSSLGVIDTFKEKIITDNNQSKSIVKSGLKNIIFHSPHHPSYSNGSNLITYDSYFKNITKFINEISSRHDRHTCIHVPYVNYHYIQLNHYRTKSLAEYMKNKLSRDDATRDNYARQVSKEFFRYNKKTPEKIKFYNDCNFPVIGSILANLSFGSMFSSS